MWKKDESGYYLIDMDNFSIVYDEDECMTSICTDDGSVFILNGDFRNEYEDILKDGGTFDDCMDFFKSVEDEHMYMFSDVVPTRDCNIPIVSTDIIDCIHEQMKRDEDEFLAKIVNKVKIRQPHLLSAVVRECQHVFDDDYSISLAVAVAVCAIYSIYAQAEVELLEK